MVLGHEESDPILCDRVVISSRLHMQPARVNASGLEKASLYAMGLSSLLRLHHLSLLNEKCMYPSGIVSMACIYALEFFSELFLVNSDMHVDLHSAFSGGLGVSSSTCGGQAVCMRRASLLS